MRQPDVEAGGNKAWLVKQNGPAWGACLAFWYIKLKNYHPVLEWFVLAVSHLRDIPGAPKAHKQQHTSTHELVIAALNPEPLLFIDLDPDNASLVTKLISPAEINQQFSNITDENAMQLSNMAVNTIILKLMRPDRANFHDWLKLFNKWIARDLW